MQTNEWGPAAWKFLHTITFSYPVNPTIDDINIFKSFFTSLQFILPCSSCRKSYSKVLKYIPIDVYLESRNGLTFWLFLVHNIVNNKLNKNLETFDNVVLLYENYRARCGNMNDIVKYELCKNNLKKITINDINDNIISTHNKYKKISKNQLKNYYNNV
jgi:hypothetical protein